MTAGDDVGRLVSRLSPVPVCDDCIAEQLGLQLRQHAQQAVRELAGSNGFELGKDTCGLCGEVKLVIRRR